jgi:hypothetical protein
MRSRSYVFYSCSARGWESKKLYYLTMNPLIRFQSTNGGFLMNAVISLNLCMIKSRCPSMSLSQPSFTINALDITYLVTLTKSTGWKQWCIPQSQSVPCRYYHLWPITYNQHHVLVFISPHLSPNLSSTHFTSPTLNKSSYHTSRTISAYSPGTEGRQP